MPTSNPVSVDRLIIVFGDQLDLRGPLVASARIGRDAFLFMEVAHESRHVPSHRQRTILFLSAMRHAARDLRASGHTVRYTTLDDPSNTHTFTGEVERAIDALSPASIACIHPGEWRVLHEAQSWQGRFHIPVTILPDEHFICPIDDFAHWATGRSALTMEYFYREQRRRTGYLMHGTGPNATPVGGSWNFDADNRKSFGRTGPSPRPPRPIRFTPDDITHDVINAVRTHLPDLPGRLSTPDDFAWPVTRTQALTALADFIQHRLALFGPYEDAMWTDEPFVYHSALSPLLNLKLLDPRECCEAALDAFARGLAPLQSVEAFIRQLIGWREFIRGIYWTQGPDYANRNGLDQHGHLPDFYWTADTDMACMHHCLSQVLDFGFGHHIQRLMVTGNFALIAGIHPRTISDWYLGMYVDAIDWVTLPNTLGMVMHADAPPGSSTTGLVGTKPYASTGRYINSMSNYCQNCRYTPTQRTGPDACPFTVFYWGFLIRNRQRFGTNQRMKMMLKHVDAMTRQQQVELTVSARALRQRFGIEHP